MEKDRKDYLIEAMQQQLTEANGRIASLLAELNIRLAEKDAKIAELEKARPAG